MDRLAVVPDTWTGLPPYDPAFEEAVMRENAAAIGRAFRVPQSVIRDALLSARIVLPGPLCLVAGT